MDKLKDRLAGLKTKTREKSASEIIKLAHSEFGQRVNFASSLGEEDQVIIDIISKVAPQIEIFTLDTGRLFQETYDLLAKTQQRYKLNEGSGSFPTPHPERSPEVLRQAQDASKDAERSRSTAPRGEVEGSLARDPSTRPIPRPRMGSRDENPRGAGSLKGEPLEKDSPRAQLNIKIYYPDTAAVEAMVKERGINLFYESVENRKMCCGIRKVEPLKRALKDVDAWICGLRREQSVTRKDIDTIEWDEEYQKIKINPLANWTLDDVRRYIKENSVEVNVLHSKGFVSIGCASCTRAIKPGEDIRAGRWWWERPEQRECGLHFHNMDKNKRLSQ